MDDSGSRSALLTDAWMRCAPSSWRRTVSVSTHRIHLHSRPQPAWQTSCPSPSRSSGRASDVSKILVDSTHPADDKDCGVIIRLDLADLLGVLHELDGVLVLEEALAVVIGKHVHRDLVDGNLAALGRGGDDGEVFAEDPERVGGLGEVPPGGLDVASVGQRSRPPT